MNNESVGIDGSEPFDWELDGLPVGNYAIYAKGTTAKGVMAVSQTINITGTYVTSDLLPGSYLDYNYTPLASPYGANKIEVKLEIIILLFLVYF